MGYIYLTNGKHPAFLTLKKLNKLLVMLQTKGECPVVPAKEELFGGKTLDQANKKLCEYLKKLEKSDNAFYLKEYYEFNCKGEEAKDNLYALLDAATIVHRLIGFKPLRNSTYDTRFPYGKQYYWVVSSQSHNEIQLLIDTNQLICFHGNLNRFIVEFTYYSIFVENGCLSIRGIKEPVLEDDSPEKRHIDTEDNSKETSDNHNQSEYNWEKDTDLSLIYYSVVTLFDYYLENHDDSEIIEFKEQTIQAIRSFSKEESFDCLTFSINLRNNNELCYISFSISEDEITVTEGGHEYDPDVGGDSYTNWAYTLWNNGMREGPLNLNQYTIKKMIDCGAYIEKE